MRLRFDRVPWHQLPFRESAFRADQIWRPRRCNEAGQASEETRPYVRSILFSPENGLGDLVDHLFFDAGKAVLGKRLARILGHRMAALEREARFVD
jgi:hypothetical protein